MQPLKSIEAYQLTQTELYGRGCSWYFNEVSQYAASQPSSIAVTPHKNTHLSVITIKDRNVWLIRECRERRRWRRRRREAGGSSLRKDHPGF